MVQKMRYNEPKSINYLLNDTQLASFQKRSHALSKMNGLLKQILPDVLNEQCRISNYRQGILIIEVSSANWLIRLRYEQENLRSFLRKNGLISLSSIQFKINPSFHFTHQSQLKNEKKDTYTRKLSLQSADLLLTLSDHCSQKLKESLIKLASHANKT